MSCIICKNSEELKIFKGLTQCKNCKLVYYESDNINFSDLYQEGYFKGEEYFDYKSDKKIIQKNFQNRLSDILKYIKKGSLFEVGCAYGFFLEMAKNFFLVSGIDITKIPTRYAKNNLGLDVQTGNYLELKINEKKDIFCLWDTIEHLTSPVEFIKKINFDLKPGGYLFMTTGDVDSLLAGVRGGSWRMIHPPTHLFYFSSKTISKLLNANGFEVVSITHPGVFRSFKQIFYSLFFLNKIKIYKKIEWIMNMIDFPIYINTYDIMLVIAKKI
jgi:2-polyprenyl-3-methyl-5-hydroxy-6-metoxy-1,4-benzoquinol methylase